MGLHKSIPDCTIFLLAKAYQKSHRMFQTRLRPFNMTSLQHLVLEGLWYEEGVTAAELGKLLVLDKATLSGVLERMVDSKWIRKKGDPKDGRVYKLYPSVKANQMKKILIDLRAKANDEILSGFTDKEKAFLKRKLRELT